MATGAQALQTVATVDAASLVEGEFLGLVARSQPALLREAASAEAKAWSVAGRLPGHASREVPAAPVSWSGLDKWLEPAEWWPGHAEDEETMLVVAGRRKTVTIAELLQSFDSPEPLYADGAGNSEPFAFLEPELQPHRPNFTAALEPIGTNLWVGSKTVSRFHYDSCENIFMQLAGAKRLRLLPPVCTAALVQHRLRKAYLGSRGQRCAEGLSEERVPNYATADGLPRRPQTVVVRAGDAFYIPFGWWHEVTALPDATTGMCVSASLNYVPFYMRLRSRAVDGPLTCNPKYRHLWTRPEVLAAEEDDEGAEDEAAKKQAKEDNEGSKAVEEPQKT